MTLGTIWAPRLLSVLRIVVGLVLLQYGTAKLFGWPDVEMFEDLKWFSLFGIAGHVRTGRRHVADPRPVHPAGGLYPVR